MSLSPIRARTDTQGAGKPGSLVIERKTGTRATWLDISGELDIASAPQLGLELREAHLDSLVVVLEPRGLTFIDCAGLHVIIDAAARARNERGWLLLVANSPVLERLITLTGVHDLVTLFDVRPDFDTFETAHRDPAERTPQLGRLRRLTAVRDNAEAAPVPSGVRETAWPHPSPGRGHAAKKAQPD